MKKLLIFAVILSVFGCASPVSHSNLPMVTYDRDTEYAVQDSDDGFGLTVYYSRYQFIPESSAVATACKSMLTSIAWEYAEKKNRTIMPINEQKIRLSMGRNGLSGITSCQAFVTVNYK